MKFRIRFAEQVVGLFFLLAVLSIGVVLIFMGINQRWFEKNHYYHSIFESGDGISVGLEIKFHGFSIGKVSSLNLRDDNRVNVEFVVFQEYTDLIMRNSVIALSSNPLGLGGGMQFYQSRAETEPVEENGLVPALSSPEGQALFAQGLVDVPASNDAISRLIDEVDPVLLNINSLIKAIDDTFRGRLDGPVADTIRQLNSVLGTANSALTDIQGIVPQVEGVMSGVNESLAGVDTVLATANSTIADLNGTVTETIGGITVQVDDLFAVVNRIGANLEQTTAAFADPTGLIPMLLGEEGSLAAFFNDNNALFNQLQSVIDELNAAVGGLNEFVGFLNGSTPQISDIMGQTSNVLEGIANNPLLRGGISEPATQSDTSSTGTNIENF